MLSAFTPPSGPAFRLRLGQEHVRSTCASPSFDPDDADLFVWDVLDPFAPPDPSQAYLRTLIQAEIERTRRYESIGPLQSLPDAVQDHPLDDWYDSESESESDADDEDGDDDADDENSECDNDAHGKDYDDGEDGDDDDSDDSDDRDDAANKPNVIALPQLLPIPLRFLPSPNPFHPPSPPSPPPRLRSPFSDTDSADDEDTLALWSDLALVYNDIAEAEERAARKAKRDAHRSRLKALAILGPEAASALPI